MIDIISLLSTDGYIICNKTILKLFGADCAVLLGELCAEYNYYKSNNELVDDMFYSVQSNITENTGLSSHSQRNAIKILSENGILEVYKMGLPAKNYFKINHDKLLNIFTTSASKNERLDVEDFNINNNKEKSNKKNNKLKKENSKLFTTTTTDTSIIEKPKKLNLFDKSMDCIREYVDSCSFCNSENDKLILTDKLVEYLNMRIKLPDRFTNFMCIINKLNERCDSLDDALETIEYSIQHKYKGLFNPPYYSNNMQQQMIDAKSLLSEDDADEFTNNLIKEAEKNGKRAVF